MAAFPSYSVGTVSIGVGATVINGNGTLWSGVNARPGDEITVAGRTVKIRDVISDTQLSIRAWPGAAVSGVAYDIDKASPLRFAGGQAMADVSDMIASLQKAAVVVPPGAMAPDPSYGSELQYAFQPTTLKYWRMVNGVWVLQGTLLGLLAANNLGDLASFNVAGANLGVVRRVTRQIFTSSGTYTPTAGMIFCIVELLGGGGAGGGIVISTASQALAGGGGGSGSSTRGFGWAALIGASQPITIGAGGAAVSGGSGGNGGASSMGSLFSAPGGFGGQANNPAQSLFGASGAGGGLGSGDFPGRGTPGGPGMGSGQIIFNTMLGGMGGSGMFGGGGIGGLSGYTPAAGGAGVLGSGGGGAAGSGNPGSAAGGAGGAGFAIITEFCTQV